MIAAFPKLTIGPAWFDSYSGLLPVVIEKFERLQDNSIRVHAKITKGKTFTGHRHSRAGEIVQCSTNWIIPKKCARLTESGQARILYYEPPAL